MPFPPKKPDLAVGVVVGKPKGGQSDGLPPLKRLDQPDNSGPADQEPDSADPNDMSQHDDGTGQAMDYAQEIVSDPDVGPAFTQFLQAMCHRLRGSGGGASDDADQGYNVGA